MALYFGKPRRWPPERPVQFILAFILLLLAVAIMVAWMLIGYRQNTPTTTPEDSSALLQQEPITQVDRCLITLDFGQSKRFLLVQTNPNNHSATVVAIPANLADNKGDTLSDILKKHGSPNVAKAVSSILDLSVPHYATFSAAKTTNFLSVFDDGIVFTLPEEVLYTDENGAPIRLSAGEHKLTAAQAAAVLQYDAWSQPAYADSTAAALTAAILNQYLATGRNYDGYFSALANAAITDLRIDNYNAFRPILGLLSDANTGALCKAAVLEGTETDGKFVPNLSNLRKKTDLYP